MCPLDTLSLSFSLSLVLPIRLSLPPLSPYSLSLPFPHSLFSHSLPLSLFPLPASVPPLPSPSRYYTINHLVTHALYALGRLVQEGIKNLTAGMDYEGESQ